MASTNGDPGLAAAREAMIESQLKPCGVVSPRVVSAFFHIPRENFVAPDRRRLAYVDVEQVLAPGRVMMSPLSLGHLIERARVVPGERVLVVAAGTGYAAALLAQIGAEVVALEADAGLAARARALLGAGVGVVEGPLAEGWAEASPYRMILVDGAVEILSEAWVAQLAEGGRMMAIVRGEDGVCRASTGSKAAGHLRLEPFVEAPAPVLAEFRKPPAFRF